MEEKDRLEEESIFAVKINRLTNQFELFKKPLSEMEQAGLELYLDSYLKALSKIRVQEIEEGYLQENDEE